LTEQHQGRRLGAEALRRCGPEAADLLYGAYAGAGLRRPALVVLAGLGTQGLEVLERFRKHGPFFKLLRRADGELLGGEPPLVLDAVARIADAGADGQQMIDNYLRTPNLAGALAAERYPRRPAEELLDFVPGYTVYRTARNYAGGRLVTGGDLTWSALDSIDSVLVVKGLITKAGKSVAAKLGRRVAATGTRKGTKAAAHSFAKEMRPSQAEWTRQGLDAVGTVKQQVEDLCARYGDDTATWPAEAREELRNLLARTPGLTIAVARDAQLLARHLSLTSVLEQARLVGRLVDVELWTPGTGPLGERQVLRGGTMQTIHPGRLNYVRESSDVGEFAVALLEAGARINPSPRPPPRSGERERKAHRASFSPSPLRGGGRGEGFQPPRLVGLPALSQRFDEAPWRTGLLIAASLLLALLAVPPIRRRFQFQFQSLRPGGPQPLRE
jgi:hypothetical protein